MEENTILQTINIFMSSDIVQEFQISLYDTQDLLVTTCKAKCYQKCQVALHILLSQFYCLITDPLNTFEKYLPFNIGQLLKDGNSFGKTQKFSMFTISVEVLLGSEIQRMHSCDVRFKKQLQWLNYSIQHIKKMEQRIIKRIEMSQLKQSLPKKCKDINNIKLRKERTKMTVTEFSKTGLFKENNYFQPTLSKFKKVQTLKCFNPNKSTLKSISSQQSQKVFEIIPIIPLKQKHRNNTVLQTFKSILSQSELQIEPPVDRNSMNDANILQEMKKFMHKAENYSRKKTCFLKNKASYNDELLQQTLKEMKEQRSFISVAHNLRNTIMCATEYNSEHLKSNHPQDSSVKQPQKFRRKIYQRLYTQAGHKDKVK